MDTLIMAIKSIHLGNIRSGKKKWEIRKRIPNCTIPFKVLCIESNSHGQIKAEFVCDNIKAKDENEFTENLLQECCVSKELVHSYADGKGLYCWHISEMIDYCNTKGYSVKNISQFGLKNTPQSWVYVKKETK